MRLRLAATLAIVLSACAHAAAPTLVGIRIPRNIIIALSDIQTEFTNETVWCLLGSIDRDGVVVVDGVWPPLTRDRTPDSASFAGCETPRVVGWYHNHPPPPSNGLTCTYSMADKAVTDADDSYAIELISCPTPAGPAFVWRFRDDSLSSLITPAAYMPADRLPN